MLYLTGISMLRFENNFGRIYCNTGQKQPPRPCIKHSLYIVKWHQTSKYVVTFFCKWKLLWKLLSTKDGKGMPKALRSNFGPIEAIETSAACSFNSCKNIMRPRFMKVTILKTKKKAER